MADKKISELTGATTPLAGTEVLPIVQSSSTKKVAVSDLTTGRVVSVGNLSIPVGTAAAPSIYTSGETTSGIYASASGAVSCSIYGQLIGEFSTSSDFRVFRRGAASQYLVESVTVAGANIFGSAAVTNLNFGIGTTTYANINSTGGNFTVNTGNLVIGTSGKGIDFSANTNATGMTSELLTWYEEGAFTPTVRGTTTVGTATYATQSGTYTRIGRMVYFQLELSWSGGTGAGQLRLGGLPFTCGNSNCAVSIGDVESVALTASYYMAGAYVFANSTQISLRECQVGGGGNNPVNYDDAGTIRVGGCYYV